MTTTRLVLIRHAKTEQVGPAGLGDHGRRLLPRGEADGEAAGQWLVSQGLVPDLVLCSSAARAEQTWAAMAAGADALRDTEVWREPAIYDASPSTLMQVLSGVPEGARTVAMVGHAPGIPAFVADLVDSEHASGEAVEAFNAGYPTMAMAVLEAPSGVRFGAMALVMMHTARGLRMP